MRSIQASKDGLAQITEKFNLTGWTQDYLAGRAECSRQTVNKFLAGQAVDKEKFKQICLALELNWGNIADLGKEQTDSIQAADINKLVALVKQHIRKYIEDRCGKMRVLDMTYPIGVSQIYTDVNILEKITATKWIKISELQKRVYADTRNFDRLSGGTIEKRVLGEDAVNIQHKLVVLGKPGSGKTTFLKHLAMQCLNSKFQSLRIPIFITLKEYSESKKNFSILDFIKNELKKLVDEKSIDFLLAEGRVLILLDGLDEVKEEEQERVCEQIEIFTRDASKLTQDFAIDREINYQERGKLQDNIKQIEAELNPKQDLGENILNLKQKEFPAYTKNIRKISDKERNRIDLQMQLKQIEASLIDTKEISKIKTIKDLIRRTTKNIQNLQIEIDRINKEQEARKKVIKTIVQQLSRFYLKEIEETKDELDYKIIVQIIYQIFRERLTPDIKELVDQIEPLRSQLDLEYPDLDEYLDKGLSFLSRKFPERIYQNRFVVTCRIALDGVNFTDFTSVEVADFDEHQIKTFAKNWFTNKPEKKKVDGYNFFVEKLSQNDSVRELATSPLLLTLLCLVFEDAADFPKNRSQLYKEGIYILLKKWDADRFIYRRKTEKEIYKELSANRKEDLFSKIACEMFEKSMYFFKRDEVESYIADYIKSLPNAKNNPEILRADSEDILKYIELQHGLLVERAKGIYSFSHLTFQEYFTARKLVDTSIPSELEKNLKSLSSHIAEKHWREVFLLAVGMLSDAGYLLTLMKSEIDIMIAGDPLIQEILNWVNQSADRVEMPFKQPAIRAFYLKYAYEIALANSPTLKSDRFTDFNLKKDAITPILDNTIDLNLVEGACLLGNRLHEANNRLRSRRDDPQFAIDVINNTDKRMIHLLAIPDLERIKENLPNPKEGESFKNWWSESGKSWNESLFSITQHPNINHDFKFDNQEAKNFRRYYNANAFLIECLYSDCYIDVNTRKTIEERLFIPLANLEEKEEILLGAKELDGQQETIRAKWAKDNRQ